MEKVSVPANTRTSGMTWAHLLLSIVNNFACKKSSARLPHFIGDHFMIMKPHVIVFTELNVDEKYTKA